MFRDERASCRLDVCLNSNIKIYSSPSLVNNAGLGMFGALETQTMAASRSVFETNFFGVLRLIKAVLPTMKLNKGGHIICVSSVGGINGVPFNGVYCASKFAVEGLMESLAPMLKKFNVK